MLKLAGTAGLALAVANLRRRARNLAVRGTVGAAGIVALVIALCFFLVALHVWLSQALGAIASAAIVGGVLLALGLLLLFLASRPMREQARAVERPAGQIGDALGEGMARLAEAAGSRRSPLRNPLFQAAGLALIVGIVLGRRTSRRD